MPMIPAFGTAPMLLLLRDESTFSHINLLNLGFRSNIKVEYVHRKSQGGADIGDIHNTGKMALNRGT